MTPACTSIHSTLLVLRLTTAAAQAAAALHDSISYITQVYRMRMERRRLLPPAAPPAPSLPSPVDPAPPCCCCSPPQPEPPLPHDTFTPSHGTRTQPLRSLVAQQGGRSRGHMPGGGQSHTSYCNQHTTAGLYQSKRWRAARQAVTEACRQQQQQQQQGKKHACLPAPTWHLQLRRALNAHAAR